VNGLGYTNTGSIKRGYSGIFKKHLNTNTQLHYRNFSTTELNLLQALFTLTDVGTLVDLYLYVLNALIKRVIEQKKQTISKTFRTQDSKIKNLVNIECIVLRRLDDGRFSADTISNHLER
jgi:hypothetical protein